MSLIQFGGLASGLDTTAMIDALMGAEKIGLTRLQNTHTAYDATKLSYGKLSTAIKDLLAKSKLFTLSGAGSGRSAVSSDLLAFTASAGAAATTGQYRISVDRLASATRASSTASIGGAIDDTSAAGLMSSLPLSGTVSAGEVALIVDGRFVHANIGAPGATTLNDALGSIATAIETQLQATDPGATVAASIVDNKVQLAITGGVATHSLRFGAGGETSNALSIFGLAGVSSTTFASGTPVTAGGSLGVVRSTAVLDAAGLTGLTSTTTGSLKINGVAIAYNTTTDSLGTILSRINASDAGVTATIDRANDRIVLTNKTAGSRAIDMVDVTGTLGAALKLAPGTVTAQTIGQTAQVTVDGQAYVSDTNHVTNAIPGVALDLVDQTVGTRTLTVDVDRTKVKASIKDFVTSFNALSDLLDSQTALPATKGGASGPLAKEASLRGLALGLRSLVTRVGSGLSGTVRSLSDIGVSTGSIGSAVGATDRLILDEDKLSKALDADPARVAELLGGSGGVMTPLVDRLTSITSANGMIESRLSGIATAVSRLTQQEHDYQDRLDLKQSALEAKFARLESTLAQLQHSQSVLAATTAKSTTA